ncbi:MAG: hypothetical protein JWQ04_521 [Pedosphaera sp.]|nr:hypothetical protein [Pedosphaera sp.]
MTLTSSATTEATVPAIVTIPADQTNATFNITTLNDGIILTSQQVTIPAGAPNYASGYDMLASRLGVPPQYGMGRKPIFGILDCGLAGQSAPIVTC